MPNERLRLLAEQLLQFAETLPVEDDNAIRLGSRFEHALKGADAFTAEDIADCIQVAEQLYAMRRYRDRIFGPENRFGEAAWDILLDLFIMEARGRSIHVTSACIASAVPQSTALRCIRELERDGLIVRDLDTNDARKSLLRLTEDGMRRMILVLRGRFTDIGKHGSPMDQSDTAVVRELGDPRSRIKAVR